MADIDTMLHDCHTFLLTLIHCLSGVNVIGSLPLDSFLHLRLS